MKSILVTIRGAGGPTIRFALYRGKDMEPIILAKGDHFHLSRFGKNNEMVEVVSRRLNARTGSCEIDCLADCNILRRLAVGEAVNSGPGTEYIYKITDMIWE